MPLAKRYIKDIIKPDIETAMNLANADRMLQEHPRHLQRFLFCIYQTFHSFMNLPVEYLRYIPGMEKESFIKGKDWAYNIGHGIVYICLGL